jgi:hypothetical protein
MYITQPKGFIIIGSNNNKMCYMVLSGNLRFLYMHWYSPSIKDFGMLNVHPNKAKYRAMGEINKKNCINETSFKQTRNGKWINSHQTIL